MDDDKLPELLTNREFQDLVALEFPESIRPLVPVIIRMAYFVWRRDYLEAPPEKPRT